MIISIWTPPLRNQLYYEFATFAGVKGAGNNVAAPQYIRAACNVALPYGRDDEIPQVHIDAYHASADKKLIFTFIRTVDHQKLTLGRNYLSTDL